jgi:hypothetical protein
VNARPNFGSYRCWSSQRRKVSRSGGSTASVRHLVSSDQLRIGAPKYHQAESRAQAHLSRKRRHLRVIGASTLTSRKKGLTSSLSSDSSSRMSAITQRPVQLVVTKSRRLSTDGNICTSVSGAGFLVHWRRWSGTSCEVLSTRRRWNPCSRTRYLAIECFPAQMPRKTSSTPVLEKIGR